MTRRRLLAALLPALVSSWIVLIPSVAHADTTVTSYSYSSAAGDWVGAGGTGSYASPPDTFVSSGTAGYMSVAVHTANDDRWTVTLAPPLGSQLRPGTYTDAQRASFRQEGHPGLDVYGQGRGCNEVFGDFTVRSIEADSAGNVTELDATFTQHCESPSAPPLTGTMKYQAPSAAPVVVTSSNPSTVEGEPVTLTAGVDDSGTGPASGSVTFLDGTVPIGTEPVVDGLASITTSELAKGAHIIAASYSGDTTHPPSTSSSIDQGVADRSTSYWFSSLAGDYIGQGATASYVPPSATLGMSGSPSLVDIGVSTATEWWHLTFSPPPGEMLRPGTYTRVERASGSQSQGHGGLDVSGDGRGCSTVYGSFTINQVETDTSGNVTLFDASFSQSCESDTAHPLNGFVRIVVPATRIVASPALASLEDLQVNAMTLRARLERLDSGQSLPGEELVFTAGARYICAAVTDAGGVATCNALNLDDALAVVSNNGYTARFAGTSSFGSSEGHGDVLDVGLPSRSPTVTAPFPGAALRPL